MQYLGPKDREEEPPPTRPHHVADSQNRHSHALRHAHYSGELEGLVDKSDSVAEMDSTADDAEL